MHDLSYYCNVKNSVAWTDAYIVCLEFVPERMKFSLITKSEACIIMSEAKAGYCNLTGIVQRLKFDLGRFEVM